MLKKLVILVSFLFTAGVAVSQTTGKISGTITDKATGEGLPGANVVVLNSTLGASTDADGFYVVLNVPVGLHDVQVSYLGYKTATVKGVRVYVDNTSALSYAMEESVNESDVVEVVAQRELIRKSETNSRQIRTSDEIKNLPVQNVQSVVSLTAGVVKSENSNTLNVRGGRGEQTAIVVDGVVQNSENDGGVRNRVNKNAIEEVTVQSGGYSAEFGSSLSGIVMTTTKTGGAKYNFLVEASTDILAAENQSGDKNINISVGGPILPDDRNHTFFISFDYFDTDDSQPTYVDKRKRSDYYNAINLVGNIKSSIGENLNIRLGGTFDMVESEPYSHSRAFFNIDKHGQHYESQNLSANLQATYTVDKNTYITAKAGLMRYKFEDYDKSFQKDLKKYGDYKLLEYQLPGSFPYSKYDLANHLDDIKTNYPAIFNELIQYGLPVMADVDSFAYGQGVNEVGSYFGVLASENPYKLHFNFFTPVNQVYNQVSKSFEQTLTFSVDLFHKIDNAQIKAGAGIKNGELRNYSVAPTRLLKEDGSGLTNQLSGWTSRTGTRNYGYDVYGNWVDDDNANYFNSDVFTENAPLKKGADAPRKPKSAFAYLSSEIVFDDFILNLGLRMDYFDPNWYMFKNLNAPSGFSSSVNIDPFDPSDVEKSKSYTEWQPRLGFSFPVDENTKFSANYSRLTQMPNYNLIYTSFKELRTDLTSTGNSITNPNLKPTSTISYEVSLQHQVSTDIVLSVNTYYREIKDLVLFRAIKGAQGTNLREYYAFDNQDYSETKGIEISIETRRINNLQMFANYTFSSATGTGSSASTNSRVATATNREQVKFQAPLSFDVPHNFNMNIDYRFGKNEGPELFGTKALENLGVNSVISYQSGRPYTPEVPYNRMVEIQSRNPITTGPISSERMPGYFDWSMRIDKSFKLDMGGTELDLNLYLDIKNVLNTKNILNVYSTSGLADEDGFLSTPGASDEPNLNSQYKLDAYRYAINSPFNYGSPRLVKLGVRVEF